MTFVQGTQWHTRRKASYEKGDMWCAQCRVWILKESIGILTHPNRQGYGCHHNECGYKMRTTSRQSKTRAIRRQRFLKREERNPILRLPVGNGWNGKSGMARDILNDLHKWKMLIQQPRNNTTSSKS